LLNQIRGFRFFAYLEPHLSLSNKGLINPVDIAPIQLMQEHESIDCFRKINMKFPRFAHLTLGLLILGVANPTMSQTLNVGLSKTPTFTDIPTISLPRQHDSSIGQAFPTNSRTAEQVNTEQTPAVERLTPPQIPTTDITRGGDGMTITRPAPQNNTVPQKQITPNTKSSYSAGMMLTGKAKVFDGHSFLVENHPVRLNGVDAPGLKQICSSMGGATWRCGEASKAFLARLIDGKEVTCRVTAPAGDGAAVSCSGRGIADIALMIVDAGLVVVNRNGKEYQSAQSFAQKKKAGLWTGNFTSPIEWRRNNP
jgi:endonuclease YncB( thermonuclease family)